MGHDPRDDIKSKGVQRYRMGRIPRLYRDDEVEEGKYKIPARRKDTGGHRLDLRTYTGGLRRRDPRPCRPVAAYEGSSRPDERAQVGRKTFYKCVEGDRKPFVNEDVTGDPRRSGQSKYRRPLRPDDIL